MMPPMRQSGTRLPGQLFVWLVMLWIGLAAGASAQDIVLSGYGTAEIDGTIGPDEWQGAGSVTFDVTTF